MNRVALGCLPLALALTAVRPVVAQRRPLHVPSPFRPGELVERVISDSDSSESYALYLPSRYRPDMRWPVLFLMDPRGRALVPLRLVQRAAERRGYVALSSYNTSSDGPMQPNIDALEAMLTDAQRLLSIDTRRLYLVGFSGTARAGWGFSRQLEGHVAGLVGFGAGLPVGAMVPPTALNGSSGFAFFGGAGSTDFNYEEVRALEKTLEEFRLPHRMEYYSGPHEWPPESVVSDAVDWMELQAMKQGLAPTTTARIDSAFSVEVAGARTLEAAGQTFEAYRRYRSLLEDFRGLHSTAELQMRVDQLGGSQPVRRTLARLDKAAQEHDAYMSKLREFFEHFRQASRPSDLEESLKKLKIAELRRASANGGDSIGALAARRLLEEVFVFASFYEARGYLQKGDAPRALAMLNLAEAIKPGDPGTCYNRAWALVKLGRAGDAVSSIECLVQAGRLDAHRLEADSNFSPLRGDPRFRPMLDRLRVQETSSPHSAPL